MYVSLNYIEFQDMLKNRYTRIMNTRLMFSLQYIGDVIKDHLVD